MLPQWIRERSFYMAGVNQAEILDAFRAEARGIVDGTSSVEESRKRLEAMLPGMGYKPLPGQEGTIKDLTSERRISIALSTNVAILHGWAQKERGLQRGAEIAYPVWELVRLITKEVPREWPARFLVAGGMITEDGRMMAPKNSEVWADLGSRESFPDALGVDYPPFAWGSGMGWKAVPRAEALKLGVIDATWQPMRPRPVSSPNASLESTPRVSEPALREALSERMRGLATWEGKKLVFTDPNGTRPMTGEALVKVWDRGMPDDFRSLPGAGLIQRDALVRWLGDHEQFRDGNNRNAWEDLLRLAWRIISKPTDRLWRGMSMSKDKLDAFLRDAGSTYRTRMEFPLESWTNSQTAANLYARTGGKSWSVILEVRNPRHAADFSALVRSLRHDVSKEPRPPLVTESEWVYTAGRSFQIVHTKTDAPSRTVYLTLEELP